MVPVTCKGEGIGDADTIDGARQIVGDHPMDRYEVNEVRAEPSPSGHTSRQWGRMIRHAAGRGVIEKQAVSPLPSLCCRHL
jgi:hypothetical protein